MPNGLRAEATLDHHQLTQREKERQFWRDVLRRLLDITIFLAERNLAFRGTEEKLSCPSNGNFLGLVDLLASYDEILSSPRDRVISGNSNDHYLSNKIQNELIGLVGEKVIQKNLASLKSAKYYSVILDCTPDVSHKEMMSVVLRYIECTRGVGVSIKESFFGYIKVNGTKGEELLDVFLGKLSDWEIDLADCRGQSYDNGANMRGKNSGVQARLSALNPKADFVPCAAHSLNLVLCDSAKSSTVSVTFFGTISRLYTMFSGSTARRAILKSHVPISLKSHCDTRWESWINCIIPLRYNLSEVLDALDELEETALEKGDGETASEAASLHANISKWPFLLCIVIWYDVLFQVNQTTKILQSSTASLQIQQSEVSATVTFLSDYRKTGYASANVDAAEIAEKLKIEQVFPVTRTRKKKRLFDYEGADDGVKLTPEERFEIDFFNTLVDQAEVSINERFQLLKLFAEQFGFLYSRNELLRVHQAQQLRKHCNDLELKFGDVSSVELVHELQRFVMLLKSGHTDQLNTALDFLNYLFENDVIEIYPNLAIALRLLLTIPVTVASAERSFSKLKLIKTFHRATMADDRLSSLAVISVESEVARRLNYDSLIDQFASEKSRRKPL